MDKKFIPFLFMLFVFIVSVISFASALPTQYSPFTGKLDYFGLRDNIKGFVDGFLMNNNNSLDINETKMNQVYLRINGSNSDVILNISPSVFIANNISSSNELRSGGNTVVGNNLWVGFEPGDCTAVTKPGDSCINGILLVNDTLSAFSSKHGGALSISKFGGAEDSVFRFGATGSFDSDNNILCDSGTPFSVANHTGDSLGFFLTSPVQTQLVSVIVEIFNSSCVLLNTAALGSDTLPDLVNISYAFGDSPILGILDNGVSFFNVGVNPDARFQINALNATGSDKFLVNIIASAKNVIGSLFTSDINGQNGFINTEFFSKSSKDVNNTITTNVLSEVDATNFNGGKIILYDGNILNAPDSVETTLLRVSSDVTNLIEDTRVTNVTAAFYDNTISTENIVVNIDDNEQNILIWEENESIIYVASDENFTRIDFILETGANSDLGLTGFYCNGTDYPSLSFSDSTSGGQVSGSIEFINPSDRGTCNSEIDGTPFSDTNNHTYIAIQRTDPIAVIDVNVTLINLEVPSSILRVGNAPDLTGAETALGWINKEVSAEGEIVSYISSPGGKVQLVTQFGKNNSAGIFGNSLMVMTNDIVNLLGGDMLDAVTCNLVYNIFNKTPFMNCDTESDGASLLVQGKGDFWNIVNFREGVVIRNSFDFISDRGEELNVFNGSIHNFIPVTFTSGFVKGEERTLLTGIFEGSISPFTNLDVSPEIWISTSSILCDSDQCAESVGTSGSSDITMTTNFSTQNVNNTELSFIYSLFNLLGADNFRVETNNFTGSGWELQFTDAGTETTIPVQIELGDTYSNLSNVGLRYVCDVSQSLRNCYVDSVKVNGTQQFNNTESVDGFDTEICGSDGSRDVNGHCNIGLRYSAELATWLFNGATNFTGAGEGFSGSGTTNNWAKFLSSNVLGNAPISDDGSLITTTIDLFVDGAISAIDWSNVSGSQIQNDLNWINETLADTLYRTDSWDNFTGIPHATPSDGDVTHFSWADEIYDWVIGLGYSTTVGTVTNVATGNGLTGGPITSAGTISTSATTAGASQYSYWDGNSWEVRNDDDTTYTASGTLLDLTGTVFSVNEGTLTDTKFCTYEAASGIVCNSDSGSGTVTSVAAGDGMDFAAITGSGSVTMGTPDSLTAGTSNAVTSTSHTHAVSGFLENVVDDTSPELGGILDANNNNISEINNLNFNDGGFIRDNGTALILGHN